MKTANRILLVRELVAAPSMSSLGGSDEDEVEQQMAGVEPVDRDAGKVIGNRAYAIIATGGVFVPGKNSVVVA